MGQRLGKAAGARQSMKIAEKHFVLGGAMKGPWPDGHQKCVFANGCFWGSEKGAWRLPGGGIYTTAVGYAGGHVEHPTYEEVCSGSTGHTESVQVIFDPTKISVVDVLRWFWESHDPSQGMGQGFDRGPMYRSALFYFTDEQKQLYEASKMAYETALKDAGTWRSITTEIMNGSNFPFYFAEDYHQQYLAKPGSRQYCSAMPLNISLPSFDKWAPQSLKDKYAPKLPEAFWIEHGPKPHCVLNSPHQPIRWAAL